MGSLLGPASQPPISPAPSSLFSGPAELQATVARLEAEKGRLDRVAAGPLCPPDARRGVAAGDGRWL